MLNLFALCIDFLQYLIIIISVEREGVIDTPLGMKEMKEMKEIEMNYIHKAMMRDCLDRCFWEVMNARTYFIDELLFTDFMDYTIDLAGDSTDLSLLLDKSTDEFVHPYIARKISIYYNTVQDLIFDIKSYLLKKYDIDYYKELEKRKAKRNERR